MILPAEIRQAIEAHSRFCHPEEACGLLAVDAESRLRMAYCLTNTERSSHRFTVDPDEHFGALLHAERNAWRLAGSFHSHPTSPPVPSQRDVAGALDPEWIHLIAGPVDDGPIDLRAYRVRDGVPSEIPLEMVPS